MAWIELHQSLFTHRKTMQAAETLDLPEVYVVAHLAALWTWALDNAPDGVLPRSPRIIAKAAQWTGEPNMLINALFDAGFLVTSEDGETLIHDWQSYAGKLIDRRKRNAEAMKKARADHQEQDETLSPPSQNSTCATRVRHVADECKPTVPYRTVQNLREENTPQSHKNGTDPQGTPRAKKPSPVYESPPTPEEVKAFCVKEGGGELAEAAFDFQVQRGWSMKSGPLTDWQAALRTWKRNEDKFRAENASRNGGRSSPPVVGGTLANAGFVQQAMPPGTKLILGERAQKNHGH